MKEKTINYLYQSITDTQSTIHGLDAKIGFLFVVIFSPLLGLNQVVSTFLEVSLKSNWFIYFSFTTVLFWLCSLFLLFLSTASISNPVKLIKGKTPNDTFYNANIYNLQLYNTFANINQTSSTTVDDEIKKLPKNEDELIESLIYEKMKIAYIRDIKIKRSRACIYITFVWIMNGLLVWLFSLLKVA